MQCSWKYVVLLALASVAIQYTAIRTLTSTSYLLCPAHSNSSSAPFSTDPSFERDDLSASRTLCQQPVCQAFKPGDTWEEWQCKKKCHPLNLTLAAKACRAKPYVAMKTVRVPVVGDLRPLLEDPRLNIKVIQLVRDPRGILSSRIETFRDLYRLWGIWQATGRRPHTLETRQFTTICDDFYSSVSTALSRPAWLRGRYMLVRYEDLSRSPLQKTKEIYDFVGLTMTPSVEEWIRVNTRATNDAQAKDKFGTMRDSAANAESWRLKLPMDMVEFSQSTCQKALRQLGYREVHSNQQLRDMNSSLVQDKTFLPFL
ncbi:hypothetical protein WMY93_012846 [Mugilogobius chulae]|uniref:Sulfotransferase n=1 Tax=Mugilogobius chulae TaxID=88201 RepID=A0AAW0NXT9_9GOBI